MKTIRALAAELQSGQTTSVKLVEQALERIASYRGQSGAAYISVDTDRALAAARASDAARAAGNVPSLLAGLPVSIKDLFDVQGEVTSAGSKALANAPAAKNDAPAVARLRHAGAILLGRTNMSEFAFSGLGLNPHYGTPRNPLDTERGCGGSGYGYRRLDPYSFRVLRINRFQANGTSCESAGGGAVVDNLGLCRALVAQRGL